MTLLEELKTATIEGDDRRGPIGKRHKTPDAAFKAWVKYAEEFCSILSVEMDGIDNLFKGGYQGQPGIHIHYTDRFGIERPHYFPIELADIIMAEIKGDVSVWRELGEHRARKQADRRDIQKTAIKELLTNVEANGWELGEENIKLLERGSK